MQEIGVCWSTIEINGENGLKRLVALGIFAHRTIMNRISTILVLLSQYLSAPLDDILGVLLEQVEDSDVEVLVSLQRISVMEDRARQVTVLDVHVLESVSVFLLQELIEKRFLQVYSFDIEQGDEAVIVTLGQDGMEHVSPLVVNIDLLVNHVLRCSSLGDQVQGNVLKAKVARDIKRRPSKLISFNDELKDIVLALDNSFVVAVIILVEARSEPLDDGRELTCVDKRKDTFAAQEHFFP